MKSMKISSKSDFPPSISQSWVDFEQTYNKFLDPLGLRVMQSQKKIKKNKMVFVILFDCNDAWTVFRTKYMLLLRRQLQSCRAAVAVLVFDMCGYQHCVEKKFKKIFGSDLEHLPVFKAIRREDPRFVHLPLVGWTPRTLGRFTSPIRNKSLLTDPVLPRLFFNHLCY